MGFLRSWPLNTAAALLAVAAGLASPTPASAASALPGRPQPLADVLPAPVLDDLSASEAREVAGAVAQAGTSSAVQVAVAFEVEGRLGITQVAARPEAVDALVTMLENQPSVAAADRDVPMRVSDVADTYVGLQWPLARLRAGVVWTAVRSGADPVSSRLPVIAVIDTGMQASHPDLQGLSVAGYDFVTGTATAAGTSTDPHGHGTHVSGIIGATVGNGLGVAGLLPHASVMPIRVLDATGSGNSSDVAAGMLWAVDHGAKVLSMSLGGANTTVLQAAADYAESQGALVVAAAGNDGNDGNAASYPCAYVTVLCVGATTRSDAIGSFSTYGAQIDVAAPGESVVSTYKNSSYVTMSGTSMATPYAAAAAAFAWTGHSDYVPAQLRNRLTATATDLGTPGRDDYFGDGLVDPIAAFSSTATLAPGLPSSFSATLSDLTVTFDWGSADRATEYRIMTLVDGAPAMTLLTTSNLTATTLVQRGSTYVFTLMAVNAGGESSSLARSLPVRPADPVLQAGSTLTWASVPGAASYAVWRDGEATPVQSSQALSYAPAAPPGSTHSFTVTAAGPSGVSDRSNAIEVSVAAAAPPPPPADTPAQVTAPARALLASTVLISAPRMLVFGTSVRVSGRSTAGAPVATQVSGPCRLVRGLLRPTSGTGVCRVTATSAATVSHSGATARHTVSLAKGRDVISTTRVVSLRKGHGVSVGMRSKSGQRISVVISGPCSLRRGVLTAHAVTGTCRLQLRTTGSQSWTKASAVRVFTIATPRRAKSR